MPIKILVISNYKGFHTARPEAEIFIGLAKLGFDIHIMTYGEAEYFKIFSENGIKVIDFHPQKKFDKSEIAFIKNYLIKENIQILQLYNSPAIINGIQAAKKLPVKIVLYRGYTGNIHWYDPTMYVKYLHPRVDKIVCNSIGVEKLIESQTLFGKSKGITINKGHRAEWYQNTVPVDVRQQFNLPADSLVLVTVANNRKMKGVPYLLKAMNTLPPELPVHLLLVGSGMDTQENIGLLSSSKAKEKVHFLGFQKEPLGIVSGSDVFVLPSIFGESITKSVLEAMSLGVAPIITDIPGNIELVVSGESGLVVKSKSPEGLKNAILQVCHHRELCKVYGQNAKTRIVNEINTDQTIIQYKQLYEQLVG